MHLMLENYQKYNVVNEVKKYAKEQLFMVVLLFMNLFARRDGLCYTYVCK